MLRRMLSRVPYSRGHVEARSAGLATLSAPAALADKAIKSLSKVPTKLLIDGQWVDPVEGGKLQVVDPRTEQKIFAVASAGKEDVDRAVAAATKALNGPWGRMSAKARGRLLYKLADAIEANAEELALLETLDNGKPIKMSRVADLPLTVDHFRYYAGWSDKITGHTLQVDGPYSAYTLREPVGVVAQVIPWNFPLLMAAWKVAPALACGNTIVLKPAEQTPLTALLLGQLALEVGIPPGVLNVLTGDGPTTGNSLVSHPGVDKIAFTGSTEVGRKIGAIAGRNIKPCSLELGGKSPVIVCPDVNVKKAVDDTHFALFFNMGQCCAAGSRIFVHERIYDEFVDHSIKAAQRRRVGDPFGDVDQGPQVDSDQYEKIMGYMKLGQQEGATLRAGGKRHGETGYYVEPTVFTDVKDDMKIARDEIFGPVQSIMKYSSYSEVLRRANDHEYGLAAGVFSNDVQTVQTLTRGLKVGTVWVNAYNLYDSAVPFGGYKNSGIGRDKGEYALHHYTQVKAVYQPLIHHDEWK